MSTRKKIIEEYEGLGGLKSLVGVYQEIAAARMQRIRGAVIQSRYFMDGLVAVFRNVRLSYKRLSVKQQKKRSANGRKVAVYVSANSGLYGEIVEKTFSLFSEFVKNEHPDVVVLGKLGMKQMQDTLPEVLFNYFDFSDDSVDLQVMDMVMRYLVKFEHVFVFHGEFKTIAYQAPIVTQVSGDSVDPTADEAKDLSKIHYLFEPSIADIETIFESEIMSSLFEQTLHESHLAKYASRMISLDRSMENIEQRMKKVNLELVRATHKIRNRKQLSTLSGVSLW